MFCFVPNIFLGAWNNFGGVYPQVFSKDTVKTFLDKLIRSTSPSTTLFACWILIVTKSNDKFLTTEVECLDIYVKSRRKEGGRYLEKFERKITLVFVRFLDKPLLISLKSNLKSSSSSTYITKRFFVLETAFSQIRYNKKTTLTHVELPHCSLA